MKEVGKRLKALGGEHRHFTGENGGRPSAPHSPVSTAMKTASPARLLNCSAVMRIILMCRWIIFSPGRTSPQGVTYEFKPKGRPGA